MVFLLVFSFLCFDYCAGQDIKADKVYDVSRITDIKDRECWEQLFKDWVQANETEHADMVYDMFFGERFKSFDEDMQFIIDSTKMYLNLDRGNCINKEGIE